MGKGNASRQERRKSAPIRSHPAFTTLVALWFAALLGLGSLIPAIEPLAGLIGLGAASPLSKLVLKIAVAALAGSAGYALGSAIASGSLRAMREEPGASHAPTMRDIEAEAQRNPIIAHEELGEWLGPVPEDSDDEGFTSEAPPAPARIDSPWLADEDGHIWSEELAYAPVPSSELPRAEEGIPPEGTTPVIVEQPLAELGMVELIERLAHAIQDKRGLPRILPANAADTVRQLEAETHARHTAYASLADMNSLAPIAANAPTAPEQDSVSEPGVTFPDAARRRFDAPPGAGDHPAPSDRQTDALRSALETLRRMSGTA